MTTSLVQEVPRRYVEQLQTTVETMRRRCVAIYDGAIRLSQRSGTFVEKAREVIEPAAYDVRDFVVNAVYNFEPLDNKNRDQRNTLLELYLGLSVLCIGLASGVISGATFFGTVYGTILNPFVELGLLFGLPIYAYLQFRKNSGIDETERRVWLFGVASFLGSILGHVLGPRLLSTAPSVLFLPPLVLGLLIDYELGPKDLYQDRQRLMLVAGGISSVVGYVMAYFVVGFALGPIVAIIVNLALLWVHFQITLSTLKSTTISGTDLQFGYIVAALLLQVVVAVVFGNSQFGEHPEAHEALPPVAQYRRHHH
uniref:Integral membrane protein n=1 Tax=Panagrellus redivivus TaxID=6233 RepID=A0A7E4UUU3_PANRE